MSAELVWEQVLQLPREEQVALARRILMAASEPPAGKFRGRPVEEMIGLASGPNPPPDDDEVRRWIDEHRMAKHG